MPKCSNCSECYYYSEIKNIQNVNLLHSYIEACSNYVGTSLQSIINDHDTQEAVLKRLKGERIAFINDKVPLAVSKIINIALMKKLNKISSSNKKFLEDYVLVNKKYCMIASCNGRLEIENIENYKENYKEHYKCIKCCNTFCTSCERLLEPDNSSHVCVKEDLSSVSLIKSMIHCPKCKTPVVKSGGCNNITCAVCFENFSYINGTPTTDGNHGSSIPVKKKNKLSLSSLYSEFYNKEIIDALILIETLEPKEQKELSLIKVIKENDPKKISKEFEKCEISRKNYKRYINTMSLIEKLHSKGLLNLFNVRLLYSELVSHYSTDPNNNNTKTVDLLFSVFNKLYTENNDEIVFPECLKLKLFANQSELPVPVIKKWLENTCNIHYYPNNQHNDPDQYQIYIVKPNPIKENLFQDLKKQYGTFYGFYGTKIKNWHIIFQEGSVKIYSNKNRVLNNSAFGTGIYLSQDYIFASSYCDFDNNVKIVGICEIINDPKSLKYLNNGKLIISKNENIVALRYIYVLDSSFKEKIVMPKDL
jgi:hypothetical protein